MQSLIPSNTSEWYKHFPFLYIFRSFRQALSPSKLALAALGIIATFLIGWVMDGLWLACGSGISGKELATSPLILDAKTIQAEETYGIFDVCFRHQFHCFEQLLKSSRKLEITGMMGDTWRMLNQASGVRLQPHVGQGYGAVAFFLAMLHGVYFLASTHWFYFLVLTLLTLVIWSMLGGTICRITAIRFARDEGVSLSKALQFNRSRLLSFIGAPLMPVIAVLVFGLCLLIAGWITRIPLLGSILGGIFFFLPLLLGILIAFAVVGAIAGVSLMWPALSTDGQDSWDSMSRSFNYVYSRPLHTLFYAFLALIFGAIMWVIVKLFVFVALYALHGFFSKAYPALDSLWMTPTFDVWYASPSNAESTGWLVDNFTGPAIALWVKLFICMVYAILISYYFTASTTVYFLLRRHVDGTDYDQLYLETDEDEEELETADTHPFNPKEQESSPPNGMEPSAEESDRTETSGSAEPEPPGATETSDNEERPTE